MADYMCVDIPLPDDYSGKVKATLIAKPLFVCDKKAVLYVHGFADYFFQDHLAKWYNEQGFHFYAIDLRKYGRSLLPGQFPGQARNLAAYFEELDLALAIIKRNHPQAFVLLNGHSTGGLTAALYAQARKGKGLVDALFLNSPFLDFNAPKFLKILLLPVLAALGYLFPNCKIPIQFSTVYGQSLHKSSKGKWNYALALKPLNGFPIQLGWIRAIYKAQAKLGKSKINLPILVMHAAKSLNLNVWDERAVSVDTVLNVADIARKASTLGSKVTVKSVTDGMHDLFLSNSLAQQQAFSYLEAWLHTILVKKIDTVSKSA